MFRKSSKHGRRPAWVSEELLAELKHKKEVQRKWKQSWATHEENRDIALACREAIRKFKAQLEVKKKEGCERELYHITEEVYHFTEVH